jgi:hypothetical protein
VKASAREEDPVSDTGGAPLAGGDSGVIELLDGDRITYQPVRPEDVRALQRCHRRLSEHSVFLRFFGAMPGADLAVLGSRGLGGMRRALIGSVSDSVVRHADCPVLVVREAAG